MNPIAKLVLALVAASAGGAVLAQSNGSADQERRDRNREEAMTKHHLSDDGQTDSGAMRHEGMREKTHEAADATRDFSHRTADKTRSFTHHQAEKMRNFGARQDARYGQHTESTAPAGEGHDAPK
jgi:hypothetical protein